MATRYVRSTDGNNADDGTTWALAKLDLVGVSAIDTAGDTIWVSDNHAESTAGAITFAGAGTNASPTLLLCGDDAAEPPTALATTATVTTTSGAITLNGSLYCYGITFTSTAGIDLSKAASCVQTFESCSLRAGNPIQASNANTQNCGSKYFFKNCTFRWSATGGGIWYGNVVIDGGSVVSGGTNVSAFFVAQSDRTHAEVLCTGFDFSNCATGVHLFQGDGGATSTGGRHGVVRNCKLPASWSGNLINGTLYPGQRYEMWNCDSGDTNYRMWVEDYTGSIKSETTIVRTSGASDGTTPLSWKMSTSANSTYPTFPLASPEMVIWNDTTGSSKTVTVEFVHDTNVAAGQGAGTASAFRDDEVWLEVHYLGTSGFPVSTVINDCVASVVATPADQTSSSVTWTTTGMTTPVKQKLSVTFTPQEKGPFIAKVFLAKASKTLYVDPMLTVS